MWFQADAGQAAQGAWWFGDGTLVQRWKAGARAVAALLRRPGSAPGGVRLPSMSDEWLRRHDAEAAKRAQDL